MSNSKNNLLKLVVYSSVDDSKNNPFIVSLRQVIPEIRNVDNKIISTK